MISKGKKAGNSYIFLVLWIVLTILAIAVLYVNSIYSQKENLYISHDSGIYDESITVRVKSYLPGKIYYTVNGDRIEPEYDSIFSDEVFMLYDGPISLEMQDDTTAYSFQFYCLREDGTTSEVYKRDYILDAKGKNRFSTTYVVSVVGDEEKLFGYEEGIFVRGRQFDEFMTANPDVNLLITVVPANYNSDAEVPVNVSIFQADGTEILSQNCGLKIYGNRTRAKNQRSFRLTARYDYDTVNEFSYAFLPNLVSEKSGTVIDAFQRLSFHSSGNDNGYAFIRTELIGELARRSGFPDVLVSESATVYVNGKYQGVYWLENTFDDRYFKEKYGDYEGEMAVSEGQLNEVTAGEGATEDEIQSAEDYNAFCTWAAAEDMSNDDNWNYACSVLDMENFARYMAIEYYIGNIDWPDNNVKVYQYRCADGETYREGTVFDGRYRYLLFDTDYGMGLQFLGWFGYDATNKRLAYLTEETELAAMFQSLLNREEFKLLFIHSVMNLMSGSFSLDEVAPVLNEYNDKRYEELWYMVEETDILKNSLWESDDNNMDNVQIELNKICNYAEYRPNIVLEELQEKWDCGNPIVMSISSGGVGNIIVGGLKTGKTVHEGLCLENVPVEIAVEPVPGVTVTGYYVNSEFLEGEKIELVPGEWRDEENNLITINVAAETEPVEVLIISAYHIRGTDDYVVLQNVGNTLLWLSDYALTDSKEELSKGKLPEKELEPGETYIVYGEKYSGKMEMNSIQLPFSWNGEEEIILVHDSKGIIDRKNLK